MLQRALVCFRTTLTHLSAFYKFYVANENQWKIGFRRPLSHILCVYISCFRGLWIVFGQHSQTLCFLKSMWIIEKSVFVDLSHTFCLSRYDASGGFGLFSDNTHTLCSFLKIMWINEKSVFVDPSHTFCLSRYDASDGFGLFSDNTHTLCGFLKIYESMKNRFS